MVFASFEAWRTYRWPKGVRAAILALELVVVFGVHVVWFGSSWAYAFGLAVMAVDYAVVCVLIRRLPDPPPGSRPHPPWRSWRPIGPSAWEAERRSNPSARDSTANLYVLAIVVALPVLATPWGAVAVLLPAFVLDYVLTCRRASFAATPR